MNYTHWWDYCRNRNNLCSQSANRSVVEKVADNKKADDYFESVCCKQLICRYTLVTCYYFVLEFLCVFSSSLMYTWFALWVSLNVTFVSKLVDDRMVFLKVWLIKLRANQNLICCQQRREMMFPTVNWVLVTVPIQRRWRKEAVQQRKFHLYILNDKHQLGWMFGLDRHLGLGCQRLTVFLIYAKN